jgi:hypothetical protein
VKLFAYGAKRAIGQFVMSLTGVDVDGGDVFAPGARLAHGCVSGGNILSRRTY